ncbi:MAG: restriction endonuclease subunit S [Bacteroidales bacterium]|nr:restriction endonuclease subunit S [Bacteroidales bacterium]
MKLKKYKLGEIAFVTKLAGFEHTKYIQGNCVHNKIDDTYIPLFIGKTIRNGKIDKNFDWYISKDIAYQLSRSFLKKKCLVLPYVGSLGDLAIFDGTYEALLGSNVAKIELNADCGYIEEFVYYFLKSPYGQSVLLKDEQGGVQKNITMESIRNVVLPSIDISIQRRIASVLSSLDSKISLNRRINSKLETIAKRLYDYWFVQFDFPDANGKPYKSSGGKMVWNDALKREIPEGWEVTNICMVADILSGGTPSKANARYWKNGTLPFFGPTDYSGNVFQIETSEHITEDGLKHCASSLFEEGVIIITARGSIGKLIIVGTPMAMNQSCYALRSKIGEYEYLYFLTTQLIDCLKAKGSGSVFKSINTLDIENSLLCVADAKTISKFCSMVKPLLNKIKESIKETARLTALRDKLLPLLMNGQVEVA